MEINFDHVELIRVVFYFNTISVTLVVCNDDSNVDWTAIVFILL